MKRESVAIDLDDVLASHVEAFIDFSNNNYGTQLTLESYTEIWADIWHVELEEIERRAAEFHIPESVAAYQVKEESKAALKKLGEDRDLYIVTARPQPLVATTEEWVNKHFEGIFKEIHFVPIWEPNNTVTKADICKQIGANCLVDDVAKHCNVVAQGGLKAILFGDYSWNRHEPIEDGVTRCKTWDEVLSYFGVTQR